MKKIISLLATMVPFAVMSQNNPGNMPELLIGKEIKILPVPSYLDMDFYEGFFNKPNLEDTYKLEGYNFLETPIDALLGRTFTVISVNHFIDELKVNRTSIELKDDKETIYYQYDPETYINAPIFEVIGGLSYTDAYYDGYIVPLEDFGKKIGLETVERRMHINFQKLNGKSPKYTITVKASSDLPANRRKGLVLHLENGEDLRFPDAKVYDWSAPEGYITEVPLTPADIEVLKKNKIAGYTLLDQEREVDSEYSHYMRGVFNRLLAK